jgi:hypothetical protein
VDAGGGELTSPARAEAAQRLEQLRIGEAGAVEAARITVLVNTTHPTSLLAPARFPRRFVHATTPCGPT